VEQRAGTPAVAAQDRDLAILMHPQLPSGQNAASASVSYNPVAPPQDDYRLSPRPHPGSSPYGTVPLQPPSL